MKFKELTIEDTTFYKGLAILMILFHNFFHWVSPAPGENEMVFKLATIKNYLTSLVILPEYSIQTTFSLLGHYGVQMFIFLSAYGLTKKYMKQDKINYFSFLSWRTIKIYIPFIISLFVWATYVVFAGWTWGQETTFLQLIEENLSSIIYKLTLISNFIPGELYAINGPWWFVSLIFQFYIVFPFLLKMAKSENGDKYLMFVSIASLLYSVIIYVSNVPLLIYGTMFPHLPEFALGIYLAKKGAIEIPKKIIYISLAIFILGNFFLPFWFLTDISVLILLLVIFQKIRENALNFTNKFILEVGIASMFIFYLNGFMRNPLVNVANYYESWWGTIIIAMIFFMIVLFFSMILTRFNNFIDKQIK